MNDVTPSEQSAFDALLRTNFLAFIHKAFESLHGAPLRPSPHIELFAALMTSVMTGQTQRLILNAPPRSLKSFVGVVTTSAWFLGRQPNTKLMIVTHDEKLSLLHADMIRTLLQTPWYQRIFPKARLQPDHNRSGDFWLTAGGSVFARSMDSAVTGHGADWILFDDPHDAGDIQSAASRERAHQQVMGKLLSRLNTQAEGRTTFIMQRLHPDDMTGRLGESGEYEVVVVPLVAEKDEVYRVGEFEWRRPAGHVLDPSAYGEGGVEALRRRLPSHVFLSQYQQIAISPASGMVREDHLIRYDVLPELPYETFISFDLNGGGAEAGSSYSCAVVVKRYQRNLYVTEVWRGKPDYEGLKRKAVEIAMRHPHARILIEDAAFGTALKSSLSQAGLRVIAVPHPTAAKVDRLSAVFDVFADQLIHVPRHEPWAPSFVEELVQFPGGTHDDQVDALVQLLGWLKPGQGGPPENPILTGVRPSRAPAGSNPMRDPNQAFRRNLMARPKFSPPKGRWR